jgi:hypothetical protein
MPANHRHHRHGSQKIAYISGFHNDGKHDEDMTVPKHLAIHRHVENPIGIGKSTAHDTNDGDDDGLQRFSKGVRQLICVTTTADYHGPHDTFYLPPWQRRASRSNFSGRAWGTASTLKVNTEGATPARIE